MLKPTIIHGDCLEALKAMDNEIFDLCLIDPPYFDYKTNYRKDKTGKLSQSLIQQSRDDQLEVMRECLKKLKPDSAFFFFTNWQEAWWFQSQFYTHLRNMIIWDKGNWTAGDLDGSLANTYEVVFLGTKDKNWKFNGERIPDIWGNQYEKEAKYNLNRVGNNRIHSTEKPVDLYKKCIEIATKPGALIFDPYVGSGSSAEACHRTGRQFLGYELDETYHRLACERIKKL